MSKWQRIQRFPRFLKTRQLLAWLRPDHARASRAIDRAYAVWAALLAGAAATGGALAGDPCPPAGQDLVVEAYATGLCDMQQLSFADDGTLYIGNGGTGCGGNPGSPEWIRRVPPGGGSFANFGPNQIPDPDSVLVDRPGSVSAPGSVLVGYWNNNGFIVAIAPDGLSMTPVSSGGLVTNPQMFQLDINDRLLIANDDDGAQTILEIAGGLPAILIQSPGSLSFTTGCDDRIYVLNWVSGGINVYDLDGVFIETLAADLGFSRIVCSSGGPFGNALYATHSDGLYRIDPDTGDAEVIGQGSFHEITFDTDGALYTTAGETIYRITYEPASCPWDCAGDGDGNVGITDFLALLAQWGQCGTTCDLGTGATGVGIDEFLDLLAHWGPCP